MKCKHNYVFDNVRRHIDNGIQLINTYHCTKCCKIRTHSKWEIDYKEDKK